MEFRAVILRLLIKMMQTAEMYRGMLGSMLKSFAVAELGTRAVRALSGSTISVAE